MVSWCTENLPLSVSMAQLLNIEYVPTKIIMLVQYGLTVRRNCCAGGIRVKIRIQGITANLLAFFQVHSTHIICCMLVMCI